MTSDPYEVLVSGHRIIHCRVQRIIRKSIVLPAAAVEAHSPKSPQPSPRPSVFYASIGSLHRHTPTASSNPEVTPRASRLIGHPLRPEAVLFFRVLVLLAGDPPRWSHSAADPPSISDHPLRALQNSDQTTVSVGRGCGRSCAPSTRVGCRAMSLIAPSVHDLLNSTSAHGSLFAPIGPPESRHVCLRPTTSSDSSAQ